MESTNGSLRRRRPRGPTLGGEVVAHADGVFGAYTRIDGRKKNGERLTARSFRCRAICTIEADSSCILQTHLMSFRVGAFDPARHCPFLAQPKARGKCLPTGRLRVFRTRLRRTRFIAPQTRSTPGTPQAKGIAQTGTRTKRKNT